ncbi:hypothetical protein AMECASPLE_036484 [Ameca splendens]|uniref:Uncharacterized protein n=1 Tax=Ameca splendens TaxID=208324 RepID=A0ABV0Z5J3_9TELE
MNYYSLTAAPSENLQTVNMFLCLHSSCRSFRVCLYQRCVGPFVCYYIPQYGLLPQLPAGIAADRKGSSSSDVTVDYIRNMRPLPFAFPCWKPRRSYNATEARFLLEKKLTRGFSLILPNDQNS